MQQAAGALGQLSIIPEMKRREEVDEEEQCQAHSEKSKAAACCAVHTDPPTLLWLSCVSTDRSSLWPNSSRLRCVANSHRSGRFDWGREM